jgi:hypothetical protein
LALNALGTYGEYIHAHVHHGEDRSDEQDNQSQTMTSFLMSLISY